MVQFRDKGNNTSRYNIYIYILLPFTFHSHSSRQTVLSTETRKALNIMNYCSPFAFHSMQCFEFKLIQIGICSILSITFCQCSFDFGQRFQLSLRKSGMRARRRVIIFCFVFFEIENDVGTCVTCSHKRCLESIGEVMDNHYVLHVDRRSDGQSLCHPRR